MSVNARGIANDKKRRAIFDFHRTNSDILIIQETHSSANIEQCWQAEWGGRVIFSHGTTAARGIAIFLTKQVQDLVSNIKTDDQGRKISIDITCNGITVSLVAIYAPNEDCPIFFQNIHEDLVSCSEHKIVIGDFNLVLDVDKDRKNTYCNNNRAMESVENLMEIYNLKDVWRERNQENLEYSWIKKLQTGEQRKASRIDFALVSAGIDQKIELIQYISSIMTDHRAIYMVIQFNQFERGCGYWKFNTTLLSDHTFVNMMNNELDKVMEKLEQEAPQKRWQEIKDTIRKIAVKYSRTKGSQDRLIISQLSEQVNEYESSLPLNSEQDKMYEQTKADLEDKMMERIQGVMFRSKAKWYECGEKNTKYFYSLEKSKYNAKTCYKILDQEGKEIENPYEILQVQRSFYEDLYGEDEEVSFRLQNTYQIKVPEDIQTIQQEQITLDDLQQAIKLMKNNRTPGKDGIPIDFYKVFWTKIKDVFYQMMLSCYQDGLLHESARQGILNLIPKANKDTRIVKNLRPITLLNTDYKIIEKVIALKMLPALEHIINRDQRGFMENRRISVNIRKMLDIIHMAEKEDLEAVVLSLDFVKCFDKCSFEILHGSLEFFQFGNIVRDWTQILYRDFSVSIQNNGHFSETIQIKKGVHQGGCCSSLYFLVIAEILALALRSNDEIEGITLNQIKSILNQFADDMDVFSLNTEKSIKAIFMELERFRQHSGFTISYEKTTLYRIGSLRHSNAMMYGIDQVAWSNEDITVLGVTIAHENLVHKNYDTLIEKTKKVLGAWQNRGLSLIGKIQVINTLVASLFVYKMMVLPRIPQYVVKNVYNIIRNFIWNDRKSKIAFKILQNPKQHGGLNLVDLTNRDKALKATWPRILSEEKDYAEIVYSIMRCPILKDNIWRCNLKVDDVAVLKIQEEFWQDVLSSWCEYNFYTNNRCENQLLWYNSNIRVKNRPFFWKDSYLNGLLYVHQLFSGKKYKSQAQIKQEFGLSELRFNSLKVAISHDLKVFFCTNDKSEFLPIAPHTYDMCINDTQCHLSRKIYKFLQDDALLVHNKYIKWIQDVGTNFCEGCLEFGRKHQSLYKVTNIPKYRSFQYRLLQRGLVTNIQLHKWGMRDTDLCTFCEQDKETLIHLFFYCTQVQQLWQDVLEYLQERFGIASLDRFNCRNVILNELEERHASVVNFICLITKQYIYKQKCFRQHLSSVQLLRLISSIENTEKYIAIKNGKIALHTQKWGVRYS